MSYDKNSVGGSGPEMDLQSLVQAALGAGKSVKLTVVEISGDGGKAPVYPADLTPCQEHCIEVLRVCRPQSWQSRARR